MADTFPPPQGGWGQRYHVDCKSKNKDRLYVLILYPAECAAGVGTLEAVVHSQQLHDLAANSDESSGGKRQPIVLGAQRILDCRNECYIPAMPSRQ